MRLPLCVHVCSFRHTFAVFFISFNFIKIYKYVCLFENLLMFILCFFSLSFFIEPPDCADVVCDLNCPSDSKVSPIYSYDPINLVTHAADTVQPPNGDDDIVVASKRKRSLRFARTVQSDRVVRHRRNVSDDTMAAAIQKCCECKCEFNKCPEFKCPPTEYKITIVQGTRIPGSCCTKFACTNQKPTCYSHNLGQHFNPTDQWKDDACTHCECTETGETNCETPICKPLTCEKKRTIDGECCPVCDFSDSKFCETDIECDRKCRNGHEYDQVRNCTLCACAKATTTMLTTKKMTTTVAMESGKQSI